MAAPETNIEQGAPLSPRNTMGPYWLILSAFPNLTRPPRGGASGSSQTLGTRRLVAATPLSTHCRRLPVSIGTWIVAVLAYADENCSDARNAETSRLRLRRSTGTEGPCSSRAASISGPPTFLKFQM